MLSGNRLERVKETPLKLPPGVQLFIPSEYRNQNDKLRTVYNRETRGNHQYTHQTECHYNIDQNEWPRLKETVSSLTNSDQDLKETTKSIADELREVKQRHEIEQKF